MPKSLVHIARLAVRACRVAWAAVYVDDRAVVTATAPEAASAQTVFRADPHTHDEVLTRPGRDRAPLGLLEGEELLDAMLPAAAPRFWATVRLEHLPEAVLCVADPIPRSPDTDVHAILEDLVAVAIGDHDPLGRGLPKDVRGFRAEAFQAVDAASTQPTSAGTPALEYRVHDTLHGAVGEAMQSAPTFEATSPPSGAEADGTGGRATRSSSGSRSSSVEAPAGLRGAGGNAPGGPADGPPFPERATEQKFEIHRTRSPLAFIEWNREGRVVDWNPAAERIFGYTAEEAQELVVWDLVPDAERTDVERVWRAQFNQMGGYFNCNSNVTKDGSIILCEWHNTPLVDADGTVFGVISLAQDVTEREAAARAVQESKEFAENLIVSMQDGIVVFDAAGRTIQVNDAFCAMTGFSREELLGTDMPYPYWPPEQYDALRTLFARTFEGVVDRYETVFQKKDGHRIPVVISPSTLRDDDGSVISYVATVRDITERKAAEDQLARERDLLEKIFDAIPVMIVVHDASEGLLRVNRAFREIIGRGTIRLPGQSGPHLELDAEAPMAMRAFVDALSDAWVDISVETENGETVESSWIGVRSSGGTRLGIGIDVTERIRRAADLERARDEAEEMNRLKSAFLANMSHEIRTPLTSILGFAEAIYDEVDGTGPELQVASDFAQLIQRGGRRLLDTLNSVLDLSRLEAGMMKVHPTRSDVGTEVRDVADLLRPMARAKAITIETEIPDSVVSAHADPAALHRVLSNLVSNAVKFTPEGGVITCRVRPADDRVCIEVQDTGVGISDDFLPHAFEPFRQESSGTDRAYEGSGLGLAVTQQLVDLMNGTIDVASTKGEGTCITVCLPKTGS
jgi:PAS domain S-box-containing protein